MTNCAVLKHPLEGTYSEVLISKESLLVPQVRSPEVCDVQIFYSALLDVASHAHSPQVADLVLDEMQQLKVPLGPAVGSSMMSLYCKVRLQAVLQMFKSPVLMVHCVEERGLCCGLSVKRNQSG